LFKNERFLSVFGQKKHLDYNKYFMALHFTKSREKDLRLLKACTKNNAIIFSKILTIFLSLFSVSSKNAG